MQQKFQNLWMNKISIASVLMLVRSDINFDNASIAQIEQQSKYQHTVYKDQFSDKYSYSNEHGVKIYPCSGCN